MRVETRFGNVLDAVVVGRLPSGLIHTVGIAVPLLRDLRVIGASYRALCDSGFVFGLENAWEIVAGGVFPKWSSTTGIPSDGGLADAKARTDQELRLSKGLEREAGVSRAEHIGDRGVLALVECLKSARILNAARSHIVLPYNPIASHCFVGEDRVIAVRDAGMSRLKRTGELELLEQLCRDIGLGLLRVYKTGKCKWAVPPNLLTYHPQD